MTTPVIIALTGGSGSGKSTLARKIQSHFEASQVAVLEQDWYYRDLSNLPRKIAAKTNFDHPDAVELNLLSQHIQELIQGNNIQAPQYCFSSFSRKTDPIEIPCRPLIVVEGIFVLHDPTMQTLYNSSVYIDVEQTVRFERRKRRDLAERGYNLEQILNFWENRACPMHEQFVLPQMQWATKVWKSLEDNTFVSEFLADLENQLARYAKKSTA